MPLALIGVGLMAGGTVASIIGNQKSAKAINQARSAYNAKQKALSDESAAIARKSIAGSTADVANKQLQEGKDKRLAIWENLQKASQPMSTALPATSNTGAGGRAQGRSQGAGAAWNSLGANADAETGAYNDWTTDQNIKNSDAAQKLMTNNNFAEGNTRLLSTQLEDASHAGDQWSGWGGIVRSLGSMAMMIPKGGAAPAMPASTGSMTLASGGVPRIGDASEQAAGIGGFTQSQMPNWSKIY